MKRILVIHGHQLVPWGSADQLLSLQREHDVDVIVTGNSKISGYRNINGLHVINPGSVTGLCDRTGRATQPSFALLKLAKDGRLFVYFYRYKEGAEKDVDIEKVELKTGIETESIAIKEEKQGVQEETVEEPEEQEQAEQKLVVHDNLQFDDSGSDDDL